MILCGSYRLSEQRRIKFPERSIFEGYRTNDRKGIESKSGCTQLTNMENVLPRGRTQGSGWN